MAKKVYCRKDALDVDDIETPWGKLWRLANHIYWRMAIRLPDAGHCAETGRLFFRPAVRSNLGCMPLLYQHTGGVTTDEL